MPDAFARAGQYLQNRSARGTMRNGWFGRRHAVDAWATMGMLRLDVRPPSDSKNGKIEAEKQKPAPDCSARALRCLR
jgi:hypothetical protein